MDFAEEMFQIDLEEEHLQIKLSDVLSAVTTPEISEDEQDKNDRSEEETAYGLILKKMLQAKTEPETTASFASLYQNKNYQTNVQRKMKKLKNVERRSNFSVLYQDERFSKQVTRIASTYPENGGRTHLNNLVALYCLVKEEANDNENKEIIHETNDKNDTSLEKMKNVKITTI